MLRRIARPVKDVDRHLHLWVIECSNELIFGARTDFVEKKTDRQSRFTNLLHKDLVHTIVSGDALRRRPFPHLKGKQDSASRYLNS